MGGTTDKQRRFILCQPSYSGVTAINSTITGNSTTGSGSVGGGIYNRNYAVVLTNSLVLGNVTSYAGVDDDEIHGTVTNNSIFVGDASLIFAQTAEVLDGNIAATGVLAGVLAVNGVPVMTVALRLDASNPALDAGDDSLAPATDARGTVRFDQPGIANLGLNISDLGAFEATEAKSLVVTTLDDVVDDTDGLTSLREAIAFANDATAGDLANGDADNDGNANDTITFDASLSGGTILLTNGQLGAMQASGPGLFSIYSWPDTMGSTTARSPFPSMRLEPQSAIRITGRMGRRSRN